MNEITPAIQSDRTLIDPKELDIYVPDSGLAIEYCGLYWHSEENGKDQWYHYNKWKECRESGVRLITVFEDEDEDKVRSAISAALGAREKGAFARKCAVREVSTKAATAFLDKYHLQGSCGKRVSYGLYDGDELIAVMAFGQPSRQSEHAWELRRFCTDGRTHAGAASKLWKAFLREQQPESVVSLSDRRWFTGEMYEKLGFVWDGEVKPDYAYVKNGERHHKSKFRKSGIARHFPEIFVEDKTEREMMVEAGFGRIWDCGKDRWVWKK